METACDVAVLGAGPAGAAAAMVLADAGLDVALVEAGGYAAPRIGETFPPQATDLLVELHALSGLETVRLESHGLRAVWGAAEPVEQHHVCHPRRFGWHVDRAGFDACLAGAAQARGADLLEGARLVGAERRPDGWRLLLARGSAETRLSARQVVDATGRRAAFARLAGARRTRADALIAAAFRPAAPLEAYGAYALIEAAADGWWYSAPVPGHRAVLVLFTDPATLRRSGDPAGLLAGAPLTAARHRGLALGEPVRHAAGASLLAPLAGDGWLAVGDAAMTFDPMSGDGVCRALRSGMDGAAAVIAALRGDSAPLAAHAQAARATFDAYARTRGDYYRMERRWPDTSFWRWAAALSDPVREAEPA